MNIIFLDFDGPMIPGRALYLPQQTGLPSVFDPCAVSLINKLAKDAEAKIVVHSRWRVYENYQRAFPCLKTHMISQGISEEHINDVFVCPGSPETSRWGDIDQYLTEFKSRITNYVVIEDQPLYNKYQYLEPNYVQVDFEEGLTFKDFNKARQILGLSPVTLILD